jgi:AcrR family transcriptional regulator
MDLMTHPSGPARTMPDDAASGTAPNAPAARSSAAKPGRRERKKAATHKAISDAATKMFVERGFDHVSTKEIADAADVSPTTVFAHFPTKETLVFDEDEEQRDGLVAAVRERAPGTSCLAALHQFFADSFEENRQYPSDQMAQFQKMVAQTPALRDYSKRMWQRYGEALASALARESGLDSPSPEIATFSHMVMQVQILAMEADDPDATLDAGFRLLDPGWTAYASTIGLDS